MPGVGDMYIQVRADTSKFVSGMQRDLDAAANRSSASFSKRMAAGMSKVGTTLTRTVTLPIAAAGGASIYLATQFESAMSKMVGLAGVPAKEIDKLKEGVLSLAEDTAQSPIELAEALYFITSSGQSGAQALDTLRVSARAAASGLGETQTVADAITSVMAAYGASNISAARTADILTASVKFGKAEASELSEGIGNLAPLASQLGVGFDQLGASIAAMTMVGVDTDTAFTNMSAIFSGLLKVTPQAADQLALVGLNANDLRETIKKPGGLLVALREIDTAFGGNEEAMAQVFPNIRALRGVMALLAQNGEKVDQVFQGVTNSVGDADHAFKTAAETSAFKFEQGLAKLQVAAIKVGETLLPIAGKIVDVVGDMADAFNELPDWGQDFVIGGALALAAVGPLLKVAASVVKIGAAIKGVSAVGGLTGGLAGLGKGAAAATPAIAGAGGAAATTAGQMSLLGTEAGAAGTATAGVGVGTVAATAGYVALFAAAGYGINRLIGTESAAEGVRVSLTKLRYSTYETSAGYEVMTDKLSRARDALKNQATLSGETITLQKALGMSTDELRGAYGSMAGNVIPQIQALRESFKGWREEAEIIAKRHPELADQFMDMARLAGLPAPMLRTLEGIFKDLNVAIEEVPPAEITAVDNTGEAFKSAHGRVDTWEKSDPTADLKARDGYSPVMQVGKSAMDAWEQSHATATLDAADATRPAFDVAKARADGWRGENPRTGIWAADATLPAFNATKAAADGWRGENPRTGIWASDASAGPFATAHAKGFGWIAYNPTTNVLANDMASPVIASLSGSKVIGERIINVYTRDLGASMLKRAGGVVRAQAGGGRSGLVQVGEAGPELVMLPYGSRVVTAQETARYLRGIASAAGARKITGSAVAGSGGGTIDASSLHLAARELIAAAAVLADATPGRQARAAFQNGIT